MSKPIDSLRSQRWFTPVNMRACAHRQWAVLRHGFLHRRAHSRDDIPKKSDLMT